MTKGWEDQFDTAKSYLDKATKQMNKFVDYKRRSTNYRVGYMVIVKFSPRQFKTVRWMHHNLFRKCECPFKILSKVGKISYKLSMPPHLKIHLVFYVNMLSHTTKTKMTQIEVNRVVRLLLSLPYMIERLRISLTIKLGENKVNKLQSCSSSIGMDNH